MNKKFTILTSSYNCDRYLMESVLSVIKQTYRPLEAVLVDDCSTDSTSNFISEIEKIYNKANVEFKYIKNLKRIYCGSSYWIALKNATGDYFGILDSDDVLEKFACEYVVNLYERYKQVAWIYTQHNKYNKYMTRIVKKGFCYAPIGNKSIYFLEKKGYNVFSHWRTFSYRLPQKDTIFKKKLRCCVDKYMGYRMEELGIGMFAKKVCYRYRRRGRGENTISFYEPLKKIRRKILDEVGLRRKKYKIISFPILKAK